jgi:hypothetical protein
MNMDALTKPQPRSVQASGSGGLGETALPSVRYRFRWRALGEDHEMVVGSESYALACYRLAIRHVSLYRGLRWDGSRAWPEDFDIDLSKPEIVS